MASPPKPEVTAPGAAMPVQTGYSLTPAITRTTSSTNKSRAGYYDCCYLQQEAVSHQQWITVWRQSGLHQLLWEEDSDV